ncbi:Serine/threonine-protein kinase smg1 [Dionaea muscipula]
MMQQGLHHQQQQQHQHLAALLSIALPKEDTSTATASAPSAAAAAATTTAAKSSSSSTSSITQEVNESNRLSAIDSLHRFILYPPNSVLVAQAATFLAQGFSRLLSDKSYPVQRSAAAAYGALCSVLCSIPLGSNGRQNHVIVRTLVDRFIAWAVPSLNNVSTSDRSTELALASLREFLTVGDVGSIDTYAFSILKACKELLDDERMSLGLLNDLLGVLTTISLRFFRHFHPHFVDIVDLLLGWAMVPDLADSGRQVIMGSFLQFQKHWVSNLQLPLGLLLKFQGDMDALLQDGTPGSPQQFQRLLTLLSCFSTVLQSTASGLLEINLLEQIVEPLNKMIIKILGCLSMIGKKYGWSKWIEHSWRCLTLLAEILGEKFASFYAFSIDMLFHSLDLDDSIPYEGGKITSIQIHGVLKTNLQLLSLQKLGLLPSSVPKILQFDAPISQLRLHPNHLVVASSAATYVFLLQHGNDEVVEQSMTCLIEELTSLKGMIQKVISHEGLKIHNSLKVFLSKDEFFALVKFDLKVLLSCIFLVKDGNLVSHPDKAHLCLSRVEKLYTFITSVLNPFDLQIQSCVELQVNVMEMLSRLSSVELLTKLSIQRHADGRDNMEKKDDLSMNEDGVHYRHSVIMVDHLRKYSQFLVKSLNCSSPLSIKVKGLDWIHQFCMDVMTICEDFVGEATLYEELRHNDTVHTLVFSVMDAASDREPQVRSRTARVFPLLLQAKIIGPPHLYGMAKVVFERLSDPDNGIRSEFVGLLSYVLPMTFYLCGPLDNQTATAGRSTFRSFGNGANLRLMNVFALKELNRRLNPQQFVSVLNYISQRWKVPLSTWIQRLICRCQNSKELVQGPVEETGNFGCNGLWSWIQVDDDILQKTSSVNNLAGIWWAIHEAARYCTSARLRTNLGGPSQTFAALERMLMDAAHVLELDVGQSDGSLSMASSSGAHILPMRLLLDFVEALKKNVYNAYDGSSVLPCVSRQSSLFFRANKKVCEDWFSRICEPMMNAALALHCYDAATHYCSLRLQELRISISSSLKDKSWGHVVDNSHNTTGRLAEDVLRIVQYISLALCRRHEPEALIGLQKWVSLNFSSVFVEEKSMLGGHGPFSWIHGLVYQAKGQYEKSAALFTHLLQSEESLSSMGADGVQFVIARVIESYTAICDWKSLESWLSELQALRAKHAGKSYSGALTTAGNEMNAIHALAHFDERDLQASWASLDLTPKSSCELTLDPKLALQRSEQMLLQAMLYNAEGKVENVLLGTQKAKSMLDEVLTVLPLDGLEEASPLAIQLNCIIALEEGCKIDGSQDRLNQFHSLLNSFLHEGTYLLSPSRQDCNAWMKIFRVYQYVLPTSLATLQLCKNLMSLARKQRNLGLANRLHSYLKDHVHGCSEQSYQKFLLTSLGYEEILLMYAENKIVDAYVNMWSFIRSGMLCLETVDSTVEHGFLKAKACLKLIDWLRQDYPDVRLEEVLSTIYNELNKVDGAYELSMMDVLVSGPSMHLITEKIAGAAAKLSTRLCPTWGKSWISYASWCFNLAKDALISSHEANILSSSLSPIFVSKLPPVRLNLTADEVSGVESMVLQSLRKSCSSKYLIEENGQNLWYESSEDLTNRSSVKSMVRKVVDVIEAAAGAPGAENFSGESLSATVASQLRMVFQEHIDVQIEESFLLSSLNDLLEIWWSLRKKRVSLFGHAAFGFMQFLSYSTSRCDIGPSTSSNHRAFCKKSGSLTLRAALYILHILLNYGAELRDALEPYLFTVPLLAWQDIIPQLFARLSSHPEHVIRKQLEGLLMMLAKLTPWSIVYPTLVDINSHDEEPAEELQHILDGLLKLYPRLVQDVQLMIRELDNVTVLWEELWLSTIQDLQGDVMRRINLLKEEAARIAQNVTLDRTEKRTINAAKYSAMMAPIVVALDRRLALISREPVTPHERWFQEEYKEQLKSAILAFKTPPACAAALEDIWQPFDRLAASLGSYQRKCSVSVEEVAPQLAHLSSSDIPMPGFEKQAMLSESDGGLTTTSQGIITISSFSNEVAILPTKTKPKKLVMLGSDGEKYMYLLKGREDLRLDARIMQLLQAVNDFLHSSADTRRCSVSIRYYSVTPISGRAGLIQWVDNVTSIYSVFKAWQQRVRFAQLSATGGGNSKGTVPPPVPRPSDMFYGKIIPALKEKGIKRVISRRDWPHDVKRKVLLDLMKETPRQLLHQELWCASAGFKAFNSKLKRFSGSLAAMSMIGHILGLGDRHLDNILLDFFTGDIVHIDYNVCFDKGQRLKVPEIVPFRLTQTLEATLGLTGVEGVFRANCEAVIGVLRKNKDILLMLLEVFVWDPLVEWTRGDFHDDAALGGEERKGMELAVSLSLFASRVQEIRVSLQENHDLLLAAVPAVESSLEKFLDVLNQYQVVSARFFHADQERSTLLRHETSAMSLVADATSKSEKLRALYEIQAHEFSQAKVAVTEKAQEAATWVEKHGRILDALQRGLIPDVQAGMKLSGVGDGLSLTSAVSVSGVPLTIIPEPTQAKCRDIDREMSQLVSELDHSVSCAVATLQTYSLALQRILPLNYLMQSPMHGWAQTLQLAISTLSSDVLAHARRQAGDLIAKAHTNNQESIRQNHEDLCLRVEEYEQEEYEQEIEKLEKGYAELLNSIGLEAESNVKDHFLSAFMKYMQSASLESQGEPDANKEKVLCLLYAAVSHLYVEVKDKLLNILKDFSAVGKISSTPPGFRGLSSELEHQIEKCIVLSEFVMDMRRLLGNGTPVADAGVDHPIGNWASNFKAAVVSCKDIVVKMTDSVLPEVIKCIVSSNSEVMDALGALAHIRESVKTTLEQLVDVELERESLLELETGYFLKVGLITEQQLALEEAAVKGRDHLSWEEAEELASQEEACRAQLDQLHQSWNQKDMRSSSLTKKEASIKSALVSSQLHFLSLFNSQEVKGQHGISSTALLRALAKPFSDLESVETVFLAHDIPLHSSDIQHLANFLGSGSQIAEYILHFKGLLGGHSFFIWKVGVMELFLDTVVQHASLFIDQNVGFDQLVDILKKKLISQLQELIGHFLIQEIASTLLGRLEKETEYLKRHLEVKMEHGFDPVEKEAAAVKKVQMMLEEYCNAHETLGAARSAVCLVREQVNDLKEAIQRTCVEIVQMEWMHDVTLTPSHNRRPISRKFLENNDKTAQLLSINRSKLLDSMQSFISKLARSVESLQALERTSITAEGQLERSMNWACGAPTLSSAGGGPQSSRIPPEFHEHLRNRKRLLQEAREKAADIMNICLGILEFEASRDGILCSPGGEMILTGRNDGAWQQAFLNVLTRLDVTFHAFSRAEQEWKLAQSNVEAASSDLFSATNDLCIASVKAKSASGDLQSTLLQMRDCAYETSVALSAFSRVAKSHTALTSECGSMLEEVLAITEDLHDVHNLAKEAASVHLSLTKVLSQGCEILLPLESLLLTDVPTMTDAMARERETKVEISPIHGQAIYQSYHPRIWEAFQSFRPLVPLLMSSVKELHSMLIGLAQTSTLHAGNLHKALEGLGDASEARSQEIIVSRKNIVDIYPEYDNATGAILSTCPGGMDENLPGVSMFSTQGKDWVSPPGSIYSSSSDSGSSSGDASLSNDNSCIKSVEQLSDKPDVEDGGDCFNSSSLSGDENEEILNSFQLDEMKAKHGVLGDREAVRSTNDLLDAFEDRQKKDLELKVQAGDEVSTMTRLVVMDGSQQGQPPRKGGSRISRGKNAFASSILRQIEMKLDGRDIFENSESTIAEQVDHLLKQASSIDNLCNMYEGWTPWI